MIVQVHVPIAKNSTKIESNITGKFNIYNMLASIACVRNYNVNYDSIINASNKVDYYKGKMDSKKIRVII